MSQEIIERFYRAFGARDHATMGACYHADAHFSDPVFPELRGAKIGAMWRMLCERGADLEVRFSDVSSDGAKGAARWDAFYTFTQTGRKVHNIIHASFRFSDGKIIEHIDDFDFWRWSRQAIGPAGILLGWSPIVRNKVRRSAGSALDAFVKKNAIV